MRNWSLCVLAGALVWIAAFAGTARAQQWEEKLQPYAGLGIAYTPISSPVINFNVPSFWGLAAGADYVYGHSNDFYSLSLNGHLSVNPNLSFGDVATSFGLFALGRIGAYCTNFNENKFGLGLGLGLNLTYLTMSYQLEYGSGLAYQGRLSQFYASPAIMARLTFNMSGRPFTVIALSNLSSVAGKMAISRFESLSVSYRYVGIGFVYYFNL